MKRFVSGLLVALVAAIGFAGLAQAANAPAQFTLKHRHSLAAVAGPSDSSTKAIDGGVPDTLAPFQPGQFFDQTKLTLGTANTTAQGIGKLILSTGLVNGGTAIDSAYAAFDVALSSGGPWIIDTSMEGAALAAQTDRAVAIPLLGDADAATAGVGGWVFWPWVRIRILTDGDLPACTATVIAPR